jgi:hypothetical protein
MSQDPKDLLRACAQSLMNAVSNLENRTSPQASRQEASREVAISNSVTESNSSQQQLQANRSTNAPSPIEEHRNLFGYRPPSVTRNSNRQPPSKRRMVTTSTGERVSIPVRNTWSRTFVCLPNKNATTVPSASQKINMALAGLDERTICFTKGGNSEHVHKKILEAFPMLSDVGGYHILRTGERGNRQLLALTIPPGIWIYSVFSEIYHSISKGLHTTLSERHCYRQQCSLEPRSNSGLQFLNCSFSVTILANLFLYDIHLSMLYYMVNFVSPYIYNSSLDTCLGFRFRLVQKWHV